MTPLGRVWQEPVELKMHIPHDTRLGVPLVKLSLYAEGGARTDVHCSTKRKTWKPRSIFSGHQHRKIGAFIEEEFGVLITA